MSITPASTSQKAGFTMVVMAALFVAFAVIAAVAIERNTTLQLIARRDAAAEQLSRLSYALIEYSVFNRAGSNLLYPCPARLDLPTTDGNFGNAVATCSVTTGDAGSPVLTSTGVPVMGTAASAVLRGMVPVQTLTQYGIGISDAFDPWGNRIMYVVNRNLTLGTASFSQASNPTISDPRPAGTGIPAPDFILISYGRDGVGGIKRSSTTIAIPCSTTNSTLYRQENCDVDTTFITTPSYVADDASGTAAAPTFSNTAYFDDIITYYRQ